MKHSMTITSPASATCLHPLLDVSRTLRVQCSVVVGCWSWGSREIGARCRRKVQGRSIRRLALGTECFDVQVTATQGIPYVDYLQRFQHGDRYLREVPLVVGGRKHWGAKSSTVDGDLRRMMIGRVMQLKVRNEG
jgi:hypothetical protein